MFKGIPYELLCLKYPKEVEDIIAKIRNGQSRKRNEDPSQFEWGFYWVIAARMGHSHAVSINDDGIDIHKTGSEDEFVASHVNRSYVYVAANIKNIRYRSEAIKYPKELMEDVRLAYRRIKGMGIFDPSLSTDEKRQIVKANQHVGFRLL